MRLRVLGCSGGIGGRHLRTTSFLVDSDVLIDAGTGVGDLSLAELSLIDHIFLSPNLARTYGAQDYFVVAADRTIPSYVARVSDHRPVLVRLSLREAHEEAAARLPRSLADEMRRLFAGSSRAYREDRAA